MKRVIHLVVFVLLCSYSIGAKAEGSMLWKEQLTINKHTLSVDASMDMIGDKEFSVWDVAPGIVTEGDAQTMANALFKTSGSPRKPYSLISDFAAEDKALLMYGISYVHPQDGNIENYEYLNLNYYKRFDASATAWIRYACEVKSNGADFASSLRKADGDTFPGLNKSVEAIAQETTAIIKLFAPDFELFMVGSLGREALTTLEKKNPTTIPRMVGLVYTRKLKSMPILYEYNTGSEPPIVYAGIDLPSEAIVVMAGDKGIAELTYDGVLAVKGKLQSNVSLLSSEQIQSIAKKELLSSLSSRDSDKNQLEMHINSIRLGYRLVKADDSSGRIVLTPAWNFYGGIRKSGHMGYNTTEFDTTNSVSFCQLSLDAITGKSLK